MAALSFCSCNPKVNTEILAEKHASGVVLIQNEYFYSIKIDDDAYIYFADYSEDEGFVGVSFDDDSIEVSTAYGTGFFVTTDGKVATNSHVASPRVNFSDANKTLHKFFRQLCSGIREEIGELDQAILMGRYYMAQTDDRSEYYEMQSQIEMVTAIRDEYQEYVDAFDELDFSADDIEVHCRLGIAYNNTHITNKSDFNECVLVANDPDNDLAIIQLKNHETPSNRYVFTLADDDDLLLEEKLYLIGYNLGPVLAFTEEGLKVQITSGNVSQNTDAQKVMYTIPTLQGSSGSPVLNEHGRVVAINFAGLNATQNFNYGIKVKNLQKLLFN